MLSSAQHESLVEIIGSEQADLVALARAVNSRWLSDDEVRELNAVLFAVFMEHLGPDSEPDATGRAADDLVGLIEMQRESFFR